ncbi:MAG: 16S rRNA processing protein RimM [Gemmatimonadota bacterium]|nr:MAG: 16S rRNA processing protein RimM [Gemmatimonadota bacterium]
MEAAYLAVARFRKPHGLKGEALCWVLTDEPERVFAVGRQLTPLDADGRKDGEPLEIEEERRYRRNWLLKFRGIGDRTELEQWDQFLLGVPQDELTPPREDEMYEHEAPGATVVVRGEPLGTVTRVLDAAGQKLLAVDMNGREVLVPFRKPIVVRIDRAAGLIEIDPPVGLLEL